MRKQVSELGIIYENDFNENVIGKILREGDLEFIPLFSCNIYVFMAKVEPFGKERNNQNGRPYGLSLLYL